MKIRRVLIVVFVGMLLCNSDAAAEVLYQTDFEKSAPGKVPDDFMVLDGQFAVKEADGNRVLELPGAPLDTYGVLFGPAESVNVAASARMFGTAKGRRMPSFALGLNGPGGYRLQVSPQKKLLELCRGQEVLTTVPFEWKSGEWTQLKLQVRQAGEGAVHIEGKAWQGSDEPSAWTIAAVETTTLRAGRPSVWGSPFSGTPIQFDDLSLRRL